MLFFAYSLLNILVVGMALDEILDYGNVMKHGQTK
jgi:hypothetical protein